MNAPSIKKDQVFALVAALILAAILSTGCSVAPVQGNTIDRNDNASVSYANCVNVLTAYGTQQVCNTVGGSVAQSYNTYTYSTTNKKGFAKVDLAGAYQSYLDALDSESQANLSAQFDALVAQYAK